MHANMCIEAELQFIFAEIPGTQMHAIPNIIPIFLFVKGETQVNASTRYESVEVLVWIVFWNVQSTSV